MMVSGLFLANFRTKVCFVMSCLDHDTDHFVVF